MASAKVEEVIRNVNMVSPDIKNEILMLHSELRKGNANALIALGILHQSKTKNYPEMTKCFTTAINKGDMPHKGYAALCLSIHHKNITQDKEQMMHYLKIAVENNNCEAMFYLGMIHYENQDFKDADPVLFRSAMLGHVLSAEFIVKRHVKQNQKHDPIVLALLKFLQKYNRMPDGYQKILQKIL